MHSAIAYALFISTRWNGKRVSSHLFGINVFVPHLDLPLRGRLASEHNDNSSVIVEARDPGRNQVTLILRPCAI